MDQVGLERTTPAGLALLTAMLGAMALGGWSLFATGAPALQVSGFMLWLLTLGVCLVFRQGGVVEDDEDRRERLERQRQQQQAGGGGGGGAPAAA
jgi:hypothetical protein